MVQNESTNCWLTCCVHDLTYHAWLMQMQINCQWNSITQCSKPQSRRHRCTTCVDAHRGYHTPARCLRSRWIWCPCDMTWARTLPGSSSPRSEECHPRSICHAIHSTPLFLHEFYLSKKRSKTMFKQTHEAIETIDKIDVTWQHNQKNVCLIKATQFKAKTLRKLHRPDSRQSVIHSLRRPLPQW